MPRSALPHLYLAALAQEANSDFTKAVESYWRIVGASSSEMAAVDERLKGIVARQYRSIPLTHYWRVPAPEVGPDLRLRVNGRRVYWRTRREIPGGIAFENFELRSAFVPGQTFIFGLSRKLPAELGVDPERRPPPPGPPAPQSRSC